MQNIAAQTYVQTQFATVGQGEILILLYDGALKFLNLAKEKILANDVGGKGIYISKTLDILSELDATLNLEIGGELSQNLHQLYFLCSTRLLQANLKMDIKIIDSVVAILTGLRNAYAQIINDPEVQAVSEKLSVRKTSFDGTRHAMPSATSVQPAAPSAARVQNAYGAYGRMNQQVN